MLRHIPFKKPKRRCNSARLGGGDGTIKELLGGKS
jgi:hypothetical protein